MRRNALGDIYANPGSRLRISSDVRRGGPFLVWIRWGWNAEWQFAITKRCGVMLRTPRRVFRFYP